MDLQKLRPTQSSWRTPLLTAEEGRARAAQRPAVASAKRILSHPPKGKGGELWQKFYNDAVERGHPYPEKLADTLLRSREHALEMEEARRRIIVTTEKPKAQETVAVTKKVARVVPMEGTRCKALTLEGRRCGFKATCGEFCKKHAVTEKM